MKETLGYTVILFTSVIYEIPHVNLIVFVHPLQKLFQSLKWFIAYDCKEYFVRLSVAILHPSQLLFGDVATVA